MESTKLNSGQIDDHDANLSNLSLITGEVKEEDLSLQDPKDNSNDITVRNTGGALRGGRKGKRSKGKDDNAIAGTVPSRQRSSLDLWMGSEEETIMTGADSASLEVKCDDEKKEENKAKDLEAAPSELMEETTMDGVDKTFLEADFDNHKKEEDNAKDLLMREDHAHSLDLLMGNIEETAMVGVDVTSLEENRDDDKVQVDNAKAMLLSELGSTFFNKKRSKKLGKVENFPRDCYSFLSLHGPCDNPLFFSFGIMVYIFQITFLLLMVFSVLHEKWHDNGDGDNPGKGIVASFIPANSSPFIQATQFFAILSSIVFADASFLDVARSVETFPTHSADATNCMVFSCVLRFSQGGLAMLVTLLLIITSESVIEIVLNFAAVNFISYLDDVAFGLALWGKYGPKLEEEANRITNLSLPSCMTRRNRHTRFQCALVIAAFPLLGTMIAIICAQASNDIWLTKVLRVEFDTKDMRAYSGCYKLDLNARKRGGGYRRHIYKSSEEVLESARFGYCIDERQWKLFTDGTDACKAKGSEMAHSTNSHAFDVSTSFDEAWFSASGAPLDLYFITFPNKTLEGNCSSLDNGVCDEFFNTFEYQFDGGDCCSRTCSHSNCGTDAITEGFGMANTTGIGFPKCTDPSMVQITISLENFTSDHDPASLAQRFTPKVIQAYESEIDDCSNWLLPPTWCKNNYSNTINPSLSLECDSKIVLLIDINPNMSNHTETVFVNDGARCTINMANRSAQRGIEDIYDPAIWYVNFTIFQGDSLDNGTKILDMNSGEQGISSFFRIPKCLFEMISPYYSETASIYEEKYQLQAIKWMMEDDSRNSDCGDEFLMDRYVLSLMNFIAPIVNGSKTLWIEKTPQCTWPEIECNHGILSALKLDSYGLIGGIPSEIGLLSSLKRLDLYNNVLSGVIPSEIGLLSSLQRLDLYENGLSGVIPSEIGLLSSLQRLDLDNNVLSGVIPSEIGLLSSLQELYLYENDLRGVIPSEIGLLSSLQTLHLYYNNLSGVILSEIGLLSSLQTLYLYNNVLSGVIPSEIALLSSLQTLDLDNNVLSGVIPSEIGLLSSLQELYLSGNFLSGAIPIEIGFLSSLKRLDLDNNTLSGVIPSEIGLLSSLQYWHLYDNVLSGVIPSEIGLLSSLQRLDLYNNVLSGVIPSEIRLLSSLQILDLSGNDLSGVIPSEIGLLSSLQELYLYNNVLSGVIPSEIGLLSSLQKLDLDENDLRGVIPSEIGLLSSLQTLDLAWNGLSGVIPSEIGLLSSLQKLYLSGNGLSGVIPSEIGLLTNLSELSLEGNNLSGLIPSELGLLNSLTYLELEIYP